MKPLLFILVLFGIGNFSCERKSKQNLDFEKWESLQVYYNLEDIERVEIENWKGHHNLVISQFEKFKEDLRSYKYDGNYARTKPGQLSCKITFKDKSVLRFYSNSSTDIIISKGLVDNHTFIQGKLVDFENY